MKRIILISLVVAALAAAETPQELYQKALVKERSDGKLDEAIQLYRRAAEAAGKDRALAANALVQLAACYEKLGNTESRKIYERVVREYADQKEAAATARSRVSALDGPTVGKGTALGTSQVWNLQDAKGGFHEIEIARDGRSLKFASPATGDIALREMSTGEIKWMGLRGAGAGGAAFSVLSSPDGRRIAYAWLSRTDHRYQLRVIGTEAGAKPRVLVNHEEFRYSHPYAWSPDGKRILTAMWKRDGTSSIAWVSAADGTFKTLRSLDWRDPEKVSLSPDGQYIAYDALERADGADRDIYVIAADGSREVAVVKNPGIDHHPVWTPEGDHLIFTSNRSHSFGLYAVAIKSGKPAGEPRLLKPEVGRTTLRSFAGAGTLYYVQTTSDQNIYKAELEPETGKLKGPAVPLATKYSGPNNMAALSPDGKLVAYLSDRRSVGGGPGSNTLIVKSLETDIERAYPADLDVTDSPTWYADSRSLLIGTHSDPPVRGRTFYKLDVESGIVKLLTHFSGFAAASRWSLSRNGEILYMPGRDVKVSTVLALSLTTGQCKTLYESPFDAERIDAVSLSPDGQTLAVAKAREIVLMDVDGGNVRALTKAWGFPGVAWSANGKHLLFVRIENELLSIPLTGGEPVTTGLRLRALRSIAAQGASLTFSSGRVEKAELWGFDNLLPMLKAAR